LTHHDFKLVPSCGSLLAGERDHPGATRTDGFDLSAVVLDAAVSGDDQPPVPSGLGYPYGVIGGGTLDRTGWSGTPVHDAPWVTRVGDFGSERRKDLGQTKDVCIEVEADDRRLRRPAHAARSEVS
jgi:hypothetical protein